MADPRPEIEIRWTAGDYEVGPESLELTVAGVEIEVECEPTIDGLLCLPVADLPIGPVFLGVSISDFEALRSTTAVVSFRMELEDEARPKVPAQGATRFGEVQYVLRCAPTKVPADQGAAQGGCGPRWVRPKVGAARALPRPKVPPDSETCHTGASNAAQGIFLQLFSIIGVN